MLIAFEGIDASGKETQSSLLSANLKAKGREVFDISFPRYGTPMGALIKRHLSQEVMLAEERRRDVDGPVLKIEYQRADEDALAFQAWMLADKADACPGIVDAIRRGEDVVSDRWWPSAYAYGRSDALDKTWLIRAHQFLPTADLVILMDVPAEVSVARVAKRARSIGRDRYEGSVSKLAVVRQRYLELWENYPTWVVVDGSPPAEVVHKTILKIVWKHLLNEKVGLHAELAVVWPGDADHVPGFGCGICGTDKEPVAISQHQLEFNRTLALGDRLRPGVCLGCAGRAQSVLDRPTGAPLAPTGPTGPQI